MKDKIIRVRLEAGMLHDRTLQFDKDIAVNPELPGEAEDTVSGPSGTPLQSSSEVPDISFSLKEEALSGWTSGRTGYPSTTIAFSYPASDLPRVTGWFTGHYDNTTQPASDTLLKNLSKACSTALAEYYQAASFANLFTSPFRIAWAFRFKDGTRRMTKVPQLMIPNAASPYMEIISSTVGSTDAGAEVGIINHPCSLAMTPLAQIPSKIDNNEVTHIDIVMAPQADMLPDPLKATGTTTVIDGERRYTSFRYNRLDETAVTGNASMQNDFRIIASIPIDEINGSTDAVAIRLPDGALANWKLLPKYSASSDADNDDPADPENPSGLEFLDPYIDKITVPLDLGMPEKRKWVKRVEIRGVFNRQGKIRISLYASRHRCNWHLVASGKRSWCSGLTAAGYRWFRVRITGEVSRGDFFDYLSFTITNAR